MSAPSRTTRHPRSVVKNKREGVSRVQSTSIRSRNKGPLSCEICILAGGISLRMSRDKALLRLGRRTLLSHIRRIAQETAMPHRIIRRDLVQPCGPLGGVYTALITSRAESVLFLSCDMPFVSARLLKEVAAPLGCREKARFVKSRDRVGFPFLIRTNALPVIEQQLTEKRFSLQQLAAALGAEQVRIPRRRTNELFNVNTPADWEKARRLWRAIRE